jgi:RimJ/RimL family protein N-acetyltransferase
MSMESHQTSDGYVPRAWPELELRPIRPDDRDQVASMFARMSFESRLMRFHAPKPRLTSRELTFLTDVDHFRHVAVAAVDRRDGSIVGTARYVQEAGRPGVADVAVEVVDELQNQGIGTALATEVIERARENGFSLLTASTMWENRPARALLRRLRFKARTSRRGELELELALAPSPNTA